MSTTISRRRLLAGAAAVGGAVTGLGGATSAVAETTAGSVTTVGGTCPPLPKAITVPPTDQRYPDLVRSWNGRFIGQPDYVRVVASTAQVEQVLAEAVKGGKRIAVRSGGHCLEGFVTNPEVKVQLDLSPMSGVYLDPARNLFVIEPGASLRQVYRTLFTEWAVTIPGGSCPAVGAGGHIVGGGYGALARRHGVVSDHLYGVEVVTVDGSGTPRTVVATAAPHDPHRDLWWAHTGGGGGNFGVVTKYFMRTPGATGTDPSRLLPRPPRQISEIRFSWPWASLTEQTFIRLARTYFQWFEQHSAPDSPYTRINANLTCLHVKSSPTVYITVEIDPTEPDSSSLLANFRAAVVDSLGVPATVSQVTYPWLQSTNATGFADTGAVVGLRNKGKGSYLRKSYTDAQLSTTYHYLTATDLTSPLAGVLFASYGGRVNAVPPNATALPQRDSVLKVLHTVYWADPSQDDTYLSWVRSFFRDVYASSGGVPELGGISDGAFINYADVDYLDPRWNKSGTPWYTFYYKDNYPRLQQVKARWDPRNVFRHALSVQLPS